MGKYQMLAQRHNFLGDIVKTIIYSAAIALLVCIVPSYSVMQFTNESNISNETASHIPRVDISEESQSFQFLIDQRRNCSNESALMNSSNASPYALYYGATSMNGVIETRDDTGWTNITGSRRWDCEDMVSKKVWFGGPTTNGSDVSGMPCWNCHRIHHMQL